MKKYCLLLMFIAAAIFQVAAQSVVKRSDAPAGALSGRNICLWQSHGRYYDAKDDRWTWQRCRLFGTVEDLYTRSYVVPFLVPMLENAGAYVILPRERDEHRSELLMDQDIDGYAETSGKHKWTRTKEPGFAMPHPLLHQGENPFTMGSARQVQTAVKPDEKEATASWSAKVPETDEYALYIGYPRVDGAVTDAKFTVHTAIGPRLVTVDQTRGAGTWIYLGTFPFTAGEHEILSLTNRSEQKGVVVADVVRLGGGMGNVVRNGHTSEMPRWAEGARYWLQYAGMPDSVYSHEADDYRDDIFCRPMWVNHLKQELNIPVDLVMAFHSDAGTEEGDLTVGTLGIYYTNKGRKFADGRPRALSGRLADSIVTSVVRDIRAVYEPDWTRRKLRDKSYIEARIPEVPTMLLELLSHQNFADMRYGLDPQFKFDVSRAVYKGILRFLASEKKAAYIVTPLAPRAFSIASRGNGEFRLSWKAALDPLESTARPDSYIIEERSDSDPFWREIGRTSSEEFSVDIPRGELRSYRVIALNRGGLSFPSEALAAGRASATNAREVLVVNGFTRVSAPDNFSEGNMGGFGLTDPGVPWGTDYSFTGKQYDFDRSHPWEHDDAPGFGASHADCETYPRTGNTFDFVATHGRALMAAGCSFVSSSVEAFVDDSSRPDAVDLILGLQKETPTGRGAMPSRFKALTPELQQRLSSLTSEGCPVLVSGSYVGSDLTSIDDKDFARRVLGFEWRTSHATAIGGVSEVRSSLFSEFGKGRFLFGMNFGSEPYQVPSVDAIFPSSPLGAIIMRYDGSQAPAAVAFSSSSHRAVTLGFPFETIRSEASRADLMKQVVKFFKL